MIVLVSSPIIAADVTGERIMSEHRKSLKLFEHERPLLIEIYLKWRIPVDQFENRPHDLDAFISTWRTLTGREDTGSELIHYMRSQRKRGLWVKMDGEHKKAPPLPEMSAEEIEVLVAVFEDNVTSLSVGSDVLAYNEEIAELIAKEFFALTGRIVPASDLIAKLTALRKRGLLPKVGKQPKPDDIGFDDIDEVPS
jgi:hypothetical protein